MKIPSVVLLSGGLDSAANLALCAERDHPVLALTADYGQKAFERENHAARMLANFYDVPHETVDLRWLGKLGGSALTDLTRTMPELSRDRLDDRVTTERSASQVWVPNRNGVLINVAAAFAEKLGAARVVVGFNIEEAATFPDNTEDYIDAATGALAYSSRNQAKVHCYTARLNKREIVEALRKLPRPFPFEKIWSCYQGGGMPCGTCESCQRLARALSSGTA